MAEEKVKKEIKEKEKKEQAPKKEFYWLFGTIAAVIVLFLAASTILEKTKTFEYEGLMFAKENFGTIPMFKYSFFTSPVTGSAVNQNTQINLLLRVDPRKNEIPVEGKIEYQAKNKFLYISTNETNIFHCEFTAIGLSSLTAFLAQNGFAVKGAIPDKALSKERDTKFADCTTNPDNTVILVQSSEESGITKKDNCYLLNINSCEDALPVFEKFMTQSIIDAKIREPI